MANTDIHLARQEHHPRLIESMLGRKLTDNELGGNFDDRQLLGAKCAVEIGHVVKDGKVFDNIIKRHSRG